MRTLAYVAAAIFVAIVLAAGSAYYCIFVPTAVLHPPRVVNINPGASMRQAAAELARAGVVRSAQLAALYAELSGAARSVQPGEYAFRGGETLPAVLRHLVNGDVVAVTVTIPEGLTLHQIAERLDDAGLACGSRFEAAARHGALVRALGLGPLGAEGYLFPATYRFAPHATASRILYAMLARFYAVMTPAVQERMFEMGLTTRQMITMASMVEKEAKAAGERPRIAEVFYNRLRLKMPLQSDPTAQYSQDGETLPAAVAVHTPSAFNTYDFVGLPPGPIANPGLASIMAALYPEQGDSLYFVARDDGTHIFSRTLAGQERAIARLRKIRRTRREAMGARRRADPDLNRGQSR